jgi:hypothetical protein
MKTPALDSAASQIAAMKDGKISATELLDRYLERIDRRNPKLNAVSHMDLSAQSGLAGMTCLPATFAPIGICPDGMPSGYKSSALTLKSLQQWLLQGNLKILQAVLSRPRVFSFFRKKEFPMKSIKKCTFLSSIPCNL